MKSTGKIRMKGGQMNIKFNTDIYLLVIHASLKLLLLLLRYNYEPTFQTELLQLKLCALYIGTCSADTIRDARRTHIRHEIFTLVDSWTVFFQFCI